jgi:hypothetical protein
MTRIDSNSRLLSSWRFVFFVCFVLCCFPFHCLLSCSLDPRPSLVSPRQTTHSYLMYRPSPIHLHRHSDSLLSSSSHSSLRFLSSLSSSPYLDPLIFILLSTVLIIPPLLPFSLILPFFAHHPHSPSQYP